MTVYEELGVRKCINAWGRITTRGGSLMPAEVLEAIAAAAEHYVDINELRTQVGRKIAELTRNEAAEVCCGAAAGVLLSTVACVAGTDMPALAQLPDTQGLKDEVVVYRAQSNPYFACIRRAGVQLREVGHIRGTQPWELEAALGSQSAAVFFFAADFYNRGSSLSLEQTIEIARTAGVPVVVDAASNLPPVENLWRFTQMGADLALFSGGKELCAPNPTGLILGRKDLVYACHLANSPYHYFGRPLKVGKEELVGILAAVKRYVSLDHNAELERWERQVAWIVQELSGITGVSARRDYPGESGVDVPRVLVRIDETRLERTMGQVLRSLRSGDPWVEVGPDVSLAGRYVNDDSEGFFVNPQALKDGEERVVAVRLREAFGAS
jgi:uncharacterized pyridoxal phosphate-dependent enzyme